MYSTQNNHALKMQFVKIKQNYIAKRNIFYIKKIIKKTKKHENVVVRHSDSNTSRLIECGIRK